MNTLRQAVQDYLTMRRSLGYKLQSAGKGLLDFATFMEQHRAPYITHSLALAWAKQPSGVRPDEWARRLSHVRIFARHRSAADPRTQIPPAGLLPYRPKRARPYLYSDKEIKDLLSAALQLPSSEGLRPWTYHCLLGLLSVSGMRVSEAQNLELKDVDLRAGVLTIRGAKFGKSRLVPLHPSTRRVLADYMSRREQVWANRPVSSYLFVSGWGNRLDGGDIRRTFYTLSRQIGLRGPSDCHGPRLHDLRHNSEHPIIPSGRREGAESGGFLASLSALSEALQEGQEVVIRLVPADARLRGIRLRQGLFLEFHVGLQIDGRCFDRFMAQPKGDDCPIDSVVKQLHSQGVAKYMRCDALVGQRRTLA